MVQFDVDFGIQLDIKFDVKFQQLNGRSAVRKVSALDNSNKLLSESDLSLCLNLDHRT